MMYVDVGSTVVYKYLDFGDIEEKTVVEFNKRDNEISKNSPIGIALWGSKVGDVVKCKAPGGEFEIEVLEIKNGSLKNIKREKELREKSAKDFNCIFSGLSYGTNSKKIYESFCKTLNWDKSQSGNFGMQGQPLFAENADTDKLRDVWFLSHLNSYDCEIDEILKKGEILDLDVADGFGAINFISQNREIIVEYITADKWKSVPKNKERVTFAKIDDFAAYEFLGVYEMTDCNKNATRRIYKRKAEVYPMDLLD